MKYNIVGFTEIAKKRVLQELKLHMRHEIIDEDAAISEVFDRVSDRVEGTHEPIFEISRSETKSGKSILIDFLANDFIYERKETKLKKAKTYLGDAVYAELDGFHLVLTNENGVEVLDKIYLQESVVAALLEYLKLTFVKKEN